MFSPVCLCHSVFATVTWQRPQRHALFEEQNISQEMFSLFFLGASRHAHISSCLIERRYMNICMVMCQVCICIFRCGCVILMMPFSSTLLRCQHSAGDCHTHRPPSKSCWDRSFFSVRTDDSRWHQIDAGTRRTHYSPFAYVCFIQKYKLTCTGGLSWKPSIPQCFVTISLIKLHLSV